jgi:hypothetical protein
MRLLLDFETPGESQRFLTATLDFMWALLTAFTADETVDLWRPSTTSSSGSLG